MNLNLTENQFFIVHSDLCSSLLSLNDNLSEL